ncbi:MAG: TetR/AcrR family transcriptional regulator [Actinobacteria bacterium]|nr:TetR/AcrR family transcriptional regulator [Actinomycetota bacterium]
MVSDLVVDTYTERLLDAALGELAQHGLRRTSLADIAKAAGVSQATLYRRFANRDELIQAAVIRAVREFLAVIHEQVEHIDDPEDRFATVFVTFIQLVRGNHLVERLMATDADYVLPALTIHGEHMFAIGRAFLVEELLRLEPAGISLTAPAPECAELLIRLGQSMLLTEATVLPLDRPPDELKAYARATFLRMVIADPVERRA